jgi:hypothetical protein
MSVRVALGLWILCSSILGQRAEGQDRSVRFVGEVTQGLEFRKSIGRGLEFVLSQDSMGGGITGWTIKISPQGQQSSSEYRDFAWVVTPPFRFQNELYLDTSYGTAAQEAVALSAREFNFVLNCEDYKEEYARVERLLWPANHPEEEVTDARAKVGQIRHGTGRLRIKDSQYTPGDKSSTPVRLGEIHWIKFEVEIKFPEGQAKNRKP